MKLQCPHCHTTFQVDENHYASILAQVRNSEFQAEVDRRIQEIEKQNAAEKKTLAAETEKQFEQRVAAMDREKSELLLEMERLRSRMENYELVKKAELAGEAAERERIVAKVKADKDREIAELRAKLASEAKQHELDLVNQRTDTREELLRKEQEISELSHRLESEKTAMEKRELELREQHSALLKAKDEEIEHYKDLKARMSTKMLGETLEKHCHNMFNRARSQGMFASAYFEKDNDASSGTKGDFIFRDYVDGEEYISIMFEMKNESDTTATKHRNEDFFAKLDKDRLEKECEYAVLVSTLEADNELYNEGIVDVSYRYEKMLVVRPQFFMSVIAMLSHAARRGAERLSGMRQELAIAKAQSIDVTNFEKRRDQFAAAFGKFVEGHLKKHSDAMAGIDKVIDSLERQAESLRKVKALFEASEQKLVRANETVVNDFTIKKLTRGNPTMKAKFDEARRLTEESED